MEKIIEKRVLYRCSICRTKYTKKKDAIQCEKRTLETRVFKVGSRVKNIEPRFCQTKQKQYYFSGTVVKILGPNPADYEYEVKWLGGKKERINAHVFTWLVKFSCPCCKEIREERYYAPELKLIGRR